MQSATHIIIWTIIGSIAILIIFLAFIYYLLKLYNNKQIEHYSNLKLSQIEHEKNLLHTKIDVQEETMQKISKEIHDNVNQLLTLSRLNLNTINAGLVGDSSKKVTLASEMITAAIGELNNISRGLSAEVISNTGLVRSLEAETERINQLESTFIALESPSGLPKIPAETQLVIYRIFQESVRNAIVHGEASKIEVKLVNKRSVIEFLVTDNGGGFNPEKYSQNNHQHQGLKNMQKRAQIINSTLDILSSAGKGTTIKLVIPLSE